METIQSIDTKEIHFKDMLNSCFDFCLILSDKASPKDLRALAVNQLRALIYLGKQLGYFAEDFNDHPKIIEGLGSVKKTFGSTKSIRNTVEPGSKNNDDEFWGNASEEVQGWRDQFKSKLNSLRVELHNALVENDTIDIQKVHTQSTEFCKEFAAQTSNLSVLSYDQIHFLRIQSRNWFFLFRNLASQRLGENSLELALIGDSFHALSDYIQSSMLKPLRSTKNLTQELQIHNTSKINYDSIGKIIEKKLNTCLLMIKYLEPTNPEV